MNRFGFLAMLLATVLMAGCGDTASNTGGVSDAGSSGDTGVTTNTPGMTPVANTDAYCKCGQVKGTDKCCADDAKMCECGKIAGSPLCCVEIPDELKDQDFCSCGWAKGSADCCSKEGELCVDCGMHKGSTLCCKIKKKSDD